MGLKVMISSQIRPSLNFKDGGFTYSKLRDCIKEKLENCQLYNCKLFDACWISEHPQGSADTISDMCKTEIDKADIILVLYRGSGEMCYLEFQHAMERCPRKVCIATFQLINQPTAEDVKFQNYFESFHRSWDYRFKDINKITFERAVEKCCQIVVERAIKLAQKGAEQSGKLYLGPALRWKEMDFAERKQKMESILETIIESVFLGIKARNLIRIEFNKKSLLVCRHAIPGRLSDSTPREMFGRPFSQDHKLIPAFDGKMNGPLHIVSCYQAVTEAQVLKILGYTDATVISAPFGVYLADNIEHLQLIFLSQCRTETATEFQVKRFRDWLDESRQLSTIIERARRRKIICEAIAKTQNEGVQ